MAEVAKDLGDAPVRELDVGSEESSHTPLFLVLAVAAVGILAFLGWKVASSGEREPAAEAPAETTTAAAAPTVVAEAAPSTISVTVTTDPSGGRIFLDDTDLGVEPAVVPVPTDSASHRLCVQLSGQRHCRELTGAALAASDPYVFTIE